MKKILKFLFFALLVFNSLNTFIFFVQYAFDAFILPLQHFSLIQRRGIISFLILTFISYFFLNKVYSQRSVILEFIVNRSIKIESIAKVIIFIIISTWAQFLSVQYLGIGYYEIPPEDKSSVDNKNIKSGLIISEYYSVFKLRSIPFLPFYECYFKSVHGGDYCGEKCNDSLKWYIYTCVNIYDCHIRKGNNFFISFFSKKYNLSPNKSITVLDGFGPFLKLNITENNDIFN